MPNIDDVVARSRQPGEFSERKRFSVARSRAIQKMREFALADTSYYILEWIQAAIANGATYLDLAIDFNEVRMSYVGGGFPQSELYALFDFLFASKDDLEVADTRQLALGVNALLNADPRSIVIESGDGTLEGTTRVEIDGRDDSVSVGTPREALSGTFVRATGFSRSRSERTELRAIEERCLTAPIPILVNDEPLFGYTSVRSPELFGYRRFIKFDEGDLYGTIGLATTPITRNFKLLTFGTWITSARHDFGELRPMGGVVGYDRLRKTADHSGIVRDEVYQEMWARLAPYARRLASGKSGAATFEIEALAGSSITPRQFRQLALEQGRAVLFLADAVQTDERRELAARYGEAFDAPVFLTSERDLDTVKHLGGPEVTVYTPRLDRAELRFYERPRAENPARPWLTGALEVGDVDPMEVVAHMEASGGGSGVSKLVREVRASGGISATVFTPADVHPGAELWVEMRVVGRKVWAGSVPSLYPGHHLVVELEQFSFEELEKMTDARAVTVMAEALARPAEPMLRVATGRVLRTLRPDQALPPAARLIVLAALARSTIKRVRRDADGNPSVRFALATGDIPDVVLEVGVLETLAGETLSMKELAGRLPATWGLVHGARSEDEIPASYDRSRIVAVDRATEKMVARIIGEACYVHVGDAREIVRYGSLVCGPTPFGLIPHDGTFPLVVEGELPSSPDDRDAHVHGLVQELLEPYGRDAPGGGGDLSPGPSGQTMRLITRHLIWFLAHATAEDRDMVADVPLFRTPDGGVLRWVDIRDALMGDGLPMYDGWSADTRWGTETSDDDTTLASREPELAMNPFVLYTLARLGELRPILDLDLSAAEARANPTTPTIAFLASEELDDGLQGEIGFPITAVDEPLVLVVDRERGTSVALRSIGAQFGVVGQVRADSDLSLEDVERRCVSVAQGLLDRLIRSLASMPGASSEYRRALEVLLSYARRRTRISAGPDGSLEVTTLDATARRVLDLPVFPTTAGVSVTPWRLLREFATFGDREPRPGRAELVSELSGVLARWLDDILDPARIAVAASERPSLPPRTTLDAWLTHALASLRTDDDGEIEVRMTSPANFRMLTERYESGAERAMLVVGTTCYVNTTFWLTEGLLRDDGTPDPERASWLLLAVYARVNALRLSVTNMHEMHFQSRIIDWLEE